MWAIFSLCLSLSLCPPSYNKISYHMHVRAAVLTVNIVIESVVAEALMLCGQARLCNKYNCHYIALAFNRMNARATCTPPQMMYDQLLWTGILELHGIHCYDPVRVSTHQCRALYCRSAWTIRRLVAEWCPEHLSKFVSTSLGIRVRFAKTWQLFN